MGRPRHLALARIQPSVVRTLSRTLVVALLLMHLAFPLSATPPPDPSEIPEDVAPSLREFGAYGWGPGEWVDPAGLLVADQTIYVSDCARDIVHVMTINGDHLASLPDPAVVELRCPRGLTKLGNHILVVDAGHRRIVSIPLGGGPLQTLIGQSHLRAPEDVATNGTLIAVSDPGAEAVHLFDRTGRLMRTCGGYGTDQGSFSRPLGISVTSEGAIVVADQQNSRVHAIDQDCSPLWEFGGYGSRPGEFAEPADVVVLDEVIFVADLTNHRLQAFSALDRSFLYQWGRHPTEAHEGDGRTHYPRFLDVEGSRAVVCEPFEVRCQVFDLDVVLQYASASPTDSPFWNKAPRFHYGTSPQPSVPCLYGVFVSEPDISQVAVIDFSEESPRVAARIGSFGDGPGQLRQPGKVALDPHTCEVFVPDGNNHRIQVFSIEGDFLREFGEFGHERGQMNGPAAIEIDARDRLLVSQAHAHRVDMFSKNGNFLGSFGEYGDGEGEFNLPLTVRYDWVHDRIIVGDTYNRRVQIFHPDGRFVAAISEFDDPDADYSGFLFPFGIAVDDEGFLYVSDAATNRITVFDADREFVHGWGAFGTEPGEFYKPKGLAFLDGSLLAIDFGNHRGQVFDRDGTPTGIFGEGFLFAVDVPAEEPSPPGWGFITFVLAAIAIAGATLFAGWRIGRRERGM